MKLTYELKFLDYWHLSSGLSAGAKLDSSVVKDSHNLPYAPAKTIKGLLREMAESLYDDAFVNKHFGIEGTEIATVYFKNARLDKETYQEILTNELQNHLYNTIASTKIGEDGIAVDDTLREIEVVVPLSLHGEIFDIQTQDDYEKLSSALKMIKRVGLNRNRGLGRCEFIVKDAK